eukprot:9439842-Pyramimonas_sp.AAC.1
MKPLWERGAQDLRRVLKRALIVAVMILMSVLCEPSTLTDDGERVHPAAVLSAGSSPSGSRTWSVSLDDLNNACPERIHIIASESTERPSGDELHAE